MREFEQADLARPVTALDAEEFGLDAGRIHRRAIDRDERIGGAARARMDEARDDFLARAGRPRDKHAASGRRDLLDQLAQLRDRRGQSDEFGIVAGLEAQLLHFALQTRRFQRARRDMDQAVGLERLLDKVVGALLDRGDGGFDRAVAGDHHHRQIGLLALERLQDLDAVEPAALQPDVEDDELRAALAHGGERRLAVAGDARLIAFVLEDARDQVADVLLVVDDQDLSRRLRRSVLAHPLTLSPWRSSDAAGMSASLPRRAARRLRPAMQFPRHGLP